jgi:purine-binding chemotaxis protein CheW
MTTQTATATDKFLTFRLKKEGYAIDVMQVVEIVRLQKITPVPHMPSYFKGVINLRGKVIPILDLRERFGLSELETSDHTCIVVVQVHTADKSILTAGLIVDEVEEVMTIASSTVQPTPEVGSHHAAEYLKGVTTMNNQVRTILDLGRLLSEEMSLRR